MKKTSDKTEGDIHTSANEKSKAVVEPTGLEYLPDGLRTKQAKELFDQYPSLLNDEKEIARLREHPEVLLELLDDDDPPHKRQHLNGRPVQQLKFEGQVPDPTPSRAGDESELALTEFSSMTKRLRFLVLGNPRFEKKYRPSLFDELVSALRGTNALRMPDARSAREILAVNLSRRPEIFVVSANPITDSEARTIIDEVIQIIAMSVAKLCTKLSAHQKDRWKLFVRRCLHEMDVTIDEPLISSINPKNQ